MEKSLFERLKDNTPKFNIGNVLDIPTGKFLNGGLQRGEFVVHSARRHGPNMVLMTQLMEANDKAKPGTPERWMTAARLLQYMGYNVTFTDPNQPPTVTWMNLEGNGKAEEKMIHDILHRDYEIEPKQDLSHLNGEDFFKALKAIVEGEPSSVVVFDSIPQESTHLS